jgi:hypothetical protein
MVSTSDITRVAAPAPSRHLMRLFAVVAVPSLPGYVFTFGIFHRVYPTTIAKPATNKATHGPANLVSLLNHPAVSDDSESI